MFNIPATSQILASKILGRVIGNIVRGFSDDPNLLHELSVYKAIQTLYPADTITLPAMFKSMLKRASTTSTEIDLSALSPEAQAIWQTDEPTEKDALLAALPEITRLYQEAEANLDAWNALPVIAKWSLLYAVENELPNKINLYRSWVEQDAIRGRVNTNASRLLKEAQESIVPFTNFVTDFLADEDNAEELNLNRLLGVAVPVRKAA